ncbi:conserved hypothetical protein [Talaromyces stipitatus ATCC 10500]|uniref:ATP-grasp domain-containing protein n=1 Tax=Talaromyces stipitatus (strain ATCC 10500 / CBS 375.48 / QM 6759 / NRRL 1006) TaxID=441959 RepID=B8MR47_TALSN|nr:uncharacterized protein TSTA_054540 [Talaromyces stipitatus ATCC 10500]EED12942.1 conserved hypothetical protein [Talaromyces stipitatus ATCC 10500]
MASPPWYRIPGSHKTGRTAKLTISLLFLPLDTFIFFVAAFLNHFHFFHHQQRHNRQLLLQNPRFYPKTILITGINTPHGLKLARQFHYGGHRVIGTDVGLSYFRSGGSMSNTIFAYYSLSGSKSQYVSNLTDIIHREKVDLWIPYSSDITPVEDAMAKGTIESRTSCKCLHLNVDYATLFGQHDAFLQHAEERGLPVVEKHTVHSRDSVHRILNRSPNKAYLIHKMSKGSLRDAVALPKSTPSHTYAQVSIIAISKDNPWVLKQRARQGNYWADLVLVRGRVKAIKIRSSRPQKDSRIEPGLYEIIRRLMDNFAEKAGPQISGHLSIKVMVDEEFAPNSVCYTVYIGGCRQGSSAVSALLDDPPSNLYTSYLEMLSPEANESVDSSIEPQAYNKSGRPQKESNYSAALNRIHIPISPVVYAAGRLWEQTQQLQHSALSYVPFGHRLQKYTPLEGSGFSVFDPLPWWWHYHVSQPVNCMLSLFDSDVETQ